MALFGLLSGFGLHCVTPALKKIF